MAITFIDYDIYGSITYVDDTPLALDPSKMYVDVLSKSQIELSFTYAGLP